VSFPLLGEERSINARGAVKRGEHDMTEKKKASTDRRSEPSESVGQKPASVKPTILERRDCLLGC
jgi:hypothetical protein